MAVIFTISVFCQCVLFNYQAFNQVETNLSECLGYYLPKLSIAAVVGGFAFLMKRKYWTVIVSLVLSVWIISNLIYFRSAGIVLDPYSFTMTGNMKGFWGSIVSYIYPTDILILMPSLLVYAVYRIFAEKFKAGDRSFPGFVIFALLGLLLHIGCYFIKRGQREVPFNPFDKTFVGEGGFGWTSNSYVIGTSIIHGFIYSLINPVEADGETPVYSLSKSDEKLLSVFCRPEKMGEGTSSPVPTGRLIVILVESLESWAVSPTVMPNICHFIETHADNCLMADKIRRQTAGGVSGDGQMIVNTGLLPVMEGAACFRFPRNAYPSISSLFKSSAIFFPGSKSVWNQGAMDEAYGIKYEYGFDQRKFSGRTNPRMDETIISSLCDNFEKYQYILALTYASHAPFRKYSRKSSADTDSAMPETMRNYLNCLHYTDSCMGVFLSLVDKDFTLKNSTIVITGDHPVFDRDRVSEFNRYLNKSGAEYEITEGNTALIIYSSEIKEKTYVSDQCYQMDIYPTVLNLIGCGGGIFGKVSALICSIPRQKG